MHRGKLAIKKRQETHRENRILPFSPSDLTLGAALFIAVDGLSKMSSNKDWEFHVEVGPSRTGGIVDASVCHKVSND